MKNLPLKAPPPPLRNEGHTRTLRGVLESPGWGRAHATGCGVLEDGAGEGVLFEGGAEEGGNGEGCGEGH